MNINATNLSFEKLNETVRSSPDRDITIDHCIGQRYIASGLSGKRITIQGTPGNALGTYLNGSEIIVRGNVQEATGDTMNSGSIIVHGSAGDATGYAMRGGKIFVEGNTGYRAGIHMKSYQDKVPILVVGGTAGSFLGEYQAGGIIVVLGLGTNGKFPAGYFCGTGMHGGKMLLRSSDPPAGLPSQVSIQLAGKEELEEVMPILEEFCDIFHKSLEHILTLPFYLLTADTKNPYRQLYTAN